MEKDKADMTVLDTLSPALKYEAMLKERGGPGPTEDKMILVFKVLDQITPHLGVFKKLMEMCRDELFESVYSDQYTGSSQETKERYIQKIPYFTLVKRVYDERDERNENLGQQLESVKKRLFDKQKQYEDATETIEGLEKNVADLQQTIADLKQAVQDMNEQIDSLEKTLESEQQKASNTEHNLNCDITELSEDLHESRTENSFLRQYKVGYDDLQQSFQNSGLEDIVPRKKRKPVIANKRAHLISGIENCNKMEEQILSIENANIEEFDKFLEEHKRTLKENTSDGSDPGLVNIQDMEIDRADQQLQTMQDRFRKSIEDITTELELLRQHRTGLQEQLQILEESKSSVKRKKKSRQSSRPTTQESSLSHGLEEDDDEDNPLMDKFTVQERVFSKFAAMLYTSDNNGKTYHEFKAARYCQSCGEKTLLCPHKILQQEHTFPLPVNATHIKIIRPKVRINMEMMDSIFQPQTSGLNTLMSVSPDGKRILSRVSINAQVSTLVESSGETPEESIPTTESTVTGISESSHFTHTVQRLWEDYKERTDLERAVPRPLSSIQTLSVIEQFAAHVLYQDEAHRDDESPGSILDALHQFMTERYHRPDVAHLVTHDFFMSLIQYCQSNKFIWLFTQTLIGNLDASVFRYLLLMGDFINKVEWKTVEDFRSFAAVVYPILTEDDLETLQMGYISFSENKISTSLVSEYIIYIIMKYREPRFLEMENRLLISPGKNAGHMSEPEFTEATDQILSVPDNKLRRWLYKEALAYIASQDSEATDVPNLRLAQISSYLQLLDISHQVNEHLQEQMEKSREQPTDSQEGNINVNKVSNEVTPQYHVTCMDEVKKLADNIARLQQARTLRVTEA